MEKRKKKWRDLINSLSEGELSVQTIFLVIALVISAFLIDSVVYVYCSLRAVAITRMLLCVAIVGNWPFVGIYMISSVLITTISHQAGGRELLLSCFMVFLLRYAKVRMVNTSFSHAVLITAGYALFEGVGYVVIQGVSGKEILGNLAVAGVLFLWYNAYEG